MGNLTRMLLLFGAGLGGGLVAGVIHSKGKTAWGRAGNSGYVRFRNWSAGQGMAMKIPLLLLVTVVWLMNLLLPFVVLSLFLGPLGEIYSGNELGLAMMSSMICYGICKATL